MPTTLELHLRRPRLTAMLRDARIGVIEAAGGYGKSSLAAELRELLALPALDVVLPVGTGASTLVGRIGLSLRRPVPATSRPASPRGDRHRRRRSKPCSPGWRASLIRGSSSSTTSTKPTRRPPALILRLVAGLPEHHRALVAGRARSSTPWHGCGGTGTRRWSTATTCCSPCRRCSASSRGGSIGRRARGRPDAAGGHRRVGGGARALDLARWRGPATPASSWDDSAGAPPDLTRLVQESLRGLPTAVA